MNSSNSSLGCLVLVVLAIGLTLASTRYSRTSYCYESGYCSPQAGFPLPIIEDQTGGSPISGWGVIDSSDYFNVNGASLIIDLLFHAALVLFIWTAVRVMRSKTRPLALLPIVPLLFLALLSLRVSPISEAEAVRIRQHFASILGNWHGIDQSTGAEFTLLFQEPSTVLIELPAFPYGNMGSYSWVDNDTLNVSFSWSSPFPEDGAGPCTFLPSFLKRNCHYTVTESSGYPISPSTTNPAPPLEPYPAPPEPLVYVRGLHSGLRADFEIKTDGNTLTLTDESGTVQTLHR